jgi:hypothetical protein
MFLDIITVGTLTLVTALAVLRLLWKGPRSSEH